MSEMRNAYKTVIVKPESRIRDHLGDLDVDGRIILKES
jgi:hypothetical protein